MAFVRIVLLCTVGAIAYGIVHDQVTARISLEYFTIGHPPLVDSEDPTVLGLAWGVVATWWVGALLGLVVAAAARVGSRPKLAARALVCPLLVLFASLAVGAAVAGLVGNVLARQGGVFLVGSTASVVPPERHVAFLTALWMHNASYGLGALGGLVLAWWTYRSRAIQPTPTGHGRAMRLDPAARSADPGLPAFLARPEGAPVYHGFPIVEATRTDGWVYGEITAMPDPGDGTLGDGYVVAPDGARAGLAWSVGTYPTKRLSPAEPGRWAVFAIAFPRPVRTMDDLVACFRHVLPELQRLYAEHCATRYDRGS